MRLVLTAVIIALLLAMLGFAMTNLETRTPVTLWETTYQDVPLWSIVFLSVLAGVISVGIIAVVDGAFVRLRSRQLLREVARLEGELNWIRTQPAGMRQEPDVPGRPAPETADDTPLAPEPGGPPSSAPVYGPEDDDPDDAYSGGRAV
ncbi:MAG TPA: LapA family protein [Candidatus Polarisedimenticolaceae bacterium]|nr:LapA family protein [Candidatus Polarisedimenticolaceae bacterium]